jgi:hypothetical protein
MYCEAVKIPNNQQSRLAQDVWIAGEAIARHRAMGSPRDAFETAVRDYADRLAASDENFKKMWQSVTAEWDAENPRSDAQEQATGKRPGSGRKPAEPTGDE